MPRHLGTPLNLRGPVPHRQGQSRTYSTPWLRGGGGGMWQPFPQHFARDWTRQNFCLQGPPRPWVHSSEAHRSLGTHTHSSSFSTNKFFQTYSCGTWLWEDVSLCSRGQVALIQPQSEKTEPKGCVCTYKCPCAHGRVTSPQTHPAPKAAAAVAEDAGTPPHLRAPMVQRHSTLRGSDVTTLNPRTDQELRSLPSTEREADQISLSWEKIQV